MLLEKFEQEGLLFNTNFTEKTSEAGTVAYRGELVLVEGEVADAQGRRKPPVSVMRHAVLLAKGDQLAMLVGCLDHLGQFKELLEKHKAEFAPDMKVVLFVVDITGPMQVEIDGINFVLIPLVQGVAWNELMDELALEKSDFKGQSAGDKVLTAWQAFSDYKPKYPQVAFEEALQKTANIKRETLGAV